MKRLSDYTEQGLIELSESDIVNLIDLECAIEGAPLLPTLPDKPVKRDDMPDKMAYTVDGKSFGSREDAQAYIDCVSKLAVLRSEYLIPNRWGGPFTMECEGNRDFAITNTRYWSRTAWFKVSGELTEYEAKLSAYELVHSKWREASKKREVVERRVRGNVSEAREKQQALIRKRSLMARYTDIVGDSAKAFECGLLAGEFEERDRHSLTGEYPSVAAGVDLSEEVRRRLRNGETFTRVDLDGSALGLVSMDSSGEIHERPIESLSEEGN